MKPMNQKTGPSDGISPDKIGAMDGLKAIYIYNIENQWYDITLIGLSKQRKHVQNV